MDRINSITIFINFLMLSSLYGQTQELNCYTDDASSAIRTDTCQEYLDVDTPDDPIWRDEFILNETTDIKYVRLVFHIFTEDDGSNPIVNTTDIQNMVDFLNTTFSQYYIQFQATHIHHKDSYLNQNTIASLNYEEHNNIKYEYSFFPQNMLNIYVLNYGGGIAFLPMYFDEHEWYNTGILISKFSLLQSDLNIVLAHEIGHSLGLWHIFHGYDEVCSPGQCPDCAQPCLEDLGLPTASWCEDYYDTNDICPSDQDCLWIDVDAGYCKSFGDTVGDRCSDTAAARLMNGNCEYLPGFNGCSYEIWMDYWDIPANNNIMGYGIKDTECTYPFIFTPQQTKRMHRILEYYLPNWYYIDINQQQVTIENQIDDQSQLGGDLSCDDIFTLGENYEHEIDFDNVNSGQNIDIILGSFYKAETHLTDDPSYVHNSWNYSELEWKLKTDTFQKTNFNDIVASFDEQFEVTMTANIAVEIEIRDPWFVDTNNEQNNDFFPFENTIYNIFLEQGGTNPNALTPPYYSIRLPFQEYHSDNMLYQFDYWDYDPMEVGFSDPIQEDTNLMFDVIFIEPNSEITAIYNPIASISDIQTSTAVDLFSNPFGHDVIEGSLEVNNFSQVPIDYNLGNPENTSIYFTDQDEYIWIDNDVLPTIEIDGFTIELDLYSPEPTTPFENSIQTIFKKRFSSDVGNPNFRISLQKLENNEYRFTIAMYPYTNVKYFFIDNIPTHFSITFNQLDNQNLEITIYVNGDLAIITHGSPSETDNPFIIPGNIFDFMNLQSNYSFNRWYLGSDRGYYSFLENFYIDEFRIWKGVLSENDIRNYMFTELPVSLYQTDENLLAYLNFNDMINHIDLSIHNNETDYFPNENGINLVNYSSIFPYFPEPWVKLGFPSNGTNIFTPGVSNIGVELIEDMIPGWGVLNTNIIIYLPQFDYSTISNEIIIHPKIDLNTGVNSISFFTEFADPSISTVLSEVGSNVNAIIGEGTIATLIDGEWFGNLTQFEVSDGYWFIMNSDDMLTNFGDPIGSITTYNLHINANLISYPFDELQSIEEGLPLDVNNPDVLLAIISEGISTTWNDDNTQLEGSLTHFEPSKGYWFIMLESNTMTFNDPPIGGSSAPLVELPQVLSQFSYSKSIDQAFYFINSATINGVDIESEDWIIAYNNDIPIGARKWNGSNSDVPIMGDDGFGWTNGYIENGETPIFKIYDSSDDIYYTCIPSGVENGLDWEINKIVKIGTLAGYIMGCTDNTALNYNPNATYDNSSCVYILGDVDNDESITVIDLTLIVDIIIEELIPSEYQLFAGDFKQDGTINILDVVELVNYLLDRVDYYLPPGIVIVTKVIKQVGSPPFIMDVSMNNTTTVTGLQLEIELDPGYKALSCDNGPYSSTMTQAYKFNVDSSIVKLVYYGPLGEDISPGNGIIANIGMEYVGTARGVHDPESGFIVGLIAANGGNEAIESEVVPYNEFVRSIGGDENLIPEEFALHAAYPNPFNPITTVKFDLSEDVLVSLIVYDLMGKHITKLINSTMNAGYHSIQWDATSVASGIYIVKLVAGEFTQTQKVALVK